MQDLENRCWVTLLWKPKPDERSGMLGSSLQSCPVVAGNAVYVADQQGMIYALA